MVDGSSTGQAVAKGFEVNLFADEKKFPQLVNPVQLQVDAKGNLKARFVAVAGTPADAVILATGLVMTVAGLFALVTHA